MENKYTVKSETVRNWKGETKTMWYGFRNGWYQRGTTSESREESVRLLSERHNISKEEIE